MDEQLLRRVVEQRRKRLPKGATRLGDVVERIQVGRILPNHRRFAGLVEELGELLGPEINKHCKIDSVSAGKLKILVDSPSYRTELRLCSHELLGQLQRQCPQAKIKSIEIGLV